VNLQFRRRLESSGIISVFAVVANKFSRLVASASQRLGRREVHNKFFISRLVASASQRLGRREVQINSSFHNKFFISRLVASASQRLGRREVQNKFFICISVGEIASLSSNFVTVTTCSDIVSHIHVAHARRLSRIARHG
jgi:hypothetical protein